MAVWGQQAPTGATAQPGQVPATSSPTSTPAQNNPYGQRNADRPRGISEAGPMPTFAVQGRVTDSLNSQGVEFATIAVAAG